MITSKSKIVLLFILTYVALSFYEPYWRLFIRGLMEGRDFTWGYVGMDGSGMSGDYWVIILITTIGIGLLYLGWRGANRLFRWLVAIWIALLVSSSLLIVIINPSVKITAETLNLELPYALVLLPFDILFTVITILWIIKNKGLKVEKNIPRWNRLNSMLLLLVIVMLPIEYFFLNLGDQHGTYDEVGVLLTFIQWVVINLSFYPWKKDKENSRERKMKS